MRAVRSEDGSSVPLKAIGSPALAGARQPGLVVVGEPVVAAVYRLRLGWLLGRRFMLITHVGCRPGRTRRTCVMVLRFDAGSGEAFVAPGSPRADWYKNIRASPAVEVAVGTRQYRPAQRFLTAEQIEQVLAWSRDHQRFRARVQSLFFGWPWLPSDEDLRRLSRSLGGARSGPR